MAFDLLREVAPNSPTRGCFSLGRLHKLGTQVSSLPQRQRSAAGGRAHARFFETKWPHGTETPRPKSQARSARWLW
jgi:hypothetical protein